MTALAPTSTPVSLVRQADTDSQLIALWLHGRSPHTQVAYRGDVARLLAFTGKGLAQTTLSDLQAFSDSLLDLKPTSRARTLAACKSLLGFGHRLGILPVDVGRALRLPPLRGQLAQRILPESDVQKMLALEPSPRNRVLLRLLYAAGVRVSELCGLCWRDCQPRDDGGQIAVFGKGGKERVILLSAATWGELVMLRGDASPEDPVFVSRQGAGALSPRQVRRHVAAAAQRAGVTANVSPHWLRHAHASHALDRGAPIHLVQATLGHASVATTGRYLHARPSDSSARYLPV